MIWDVSCNLNLICNLNKKIKDILHHENERLKSSIGEYHLYNQKSNLKKKETYRFQASLEQKRKLK